mmetsp:Transcript_13917/g.40019  ORF Transcript_13917/g.40019 Transcript_13917/m.40019 type:complete len:407 (-) Transcript_13917:594-1814(-)
MLLVLPGDEAAARLGLEVAHLLLQDLRQRLGRRGRIIVVPRRRVSAVAGLLLPVLVPLGGVEDVLGVELLLFADEQRHARVVVAHEHVVGQTVHLLAGALVVGAVAVISGLFLVASAALPASVALPLQQCDEGRTRPQKAIGRRGVLQLGPVDVARLERREGRGRRPRPAAATDHGGPVPLHDSRAEDGMDLQEIPQELLPPHAGTAAAARPPAGSGGGIGPDRFRPGRGRAGTALDLDPVARPEDEDDRGGGPGRLPRLGRDGFHPEELVEHQDAADVWVGPVGVQGHADQGGEGRDFVVGGNVVVTTAAALGPPPSGGLAALFRVLGLALRRLALPTPVLAGGVGRPIVVGAEHLVVPSRRGFADGIGVVITVTTNAVIPVVLDSLLVVIVVAVHPPDLVGHPP